MAILVSKLKSDLKPWILNNVPMEILDSLQDSDFVAIWNYVARDINDLCQVRVERFRQACNADNAEEATFTNYLLQGVIKKIFSVTVDEPTIDGETQYYTYTADRFVLRIPPTEDTILDIFYLRDIEDVTITGTDEVDLPNETYHEFLDLVKARILSDYSLRDGIDYHVKLQALKAQIVRRVGQPLLKKEVASSWFSQTGDTRAYDITRNYLGLENWVADLSGDYTHVDD